MKLSIFISHVDIYNKDEATEYLLIAAAHLGNWRIEQDWYRYGWNLFCLI